MATETFKALRPAFSSAELIFLQGWGEPLLHPRFWELAREAVASEARVGFTTNGVLLDRERREALLASGVEILGVTLAGATPGTHDRYRPGSPLEVLDENLRRLREDKESSGASRPALHVAVQLLTGNLGEVEEMLALARRWGAAQVVASPLSLVLSRELEAESLHGPHPHLHPHPHHPRDRTDVEAVLERAGEKAEATGMTFHRYRITEPILQATCRENPLHSCFVSAEGDVSPCVMTNLGVGPEAGETHRFGGEDHPLEPLTFGNVRERSLKEIWRSPASLAFRRALRERVYTGNRSTRGLPAPCRHCHKLREA